MASSTEASEVQALRRLFTYTEQLPKLARTREELSAAVGKLVFDRQLAIEGIARLKPELAKVEVWSSSDQLEPATAEGSEAYHVWQGAKQLGEEGHTNNDCHLNLLLPRRDEDGLQLEAGVNLITSTRTQTLVRIHNGDYEAFDSLITGSKQKIDDETLQTVEDITFMRWGVPPYEDPDASVGITFGHKPIEWVNVERGDITTLPEALYMTRSGGLVDKPRMYGAMIEQLWRELCILRTSVGLEGLMQ